MSDDYNLLIARLQRGAGTRSYSTTHSLETRVFSALEDASPGYHWNGMRRGADPAHPFFLFQYTVAGWGCYEDAHGRHLLPVGQAFSAVLPSEHRYYLPSASSGWRYLWVLIFHPYVVQRLAARLSELPAVLALEPTHQLVLRAADLHDQSYHHMPLDHAAQEEQVFRFLWEYERHANCQRPQAERERLLGDVRRFVQAAFDRPIGVAELASWHGLSRSAFSHHFKAVTGQPPASFIQQVRLDEATRQLLHTPASVAEIAAATGFASPNHFCKVFRQKFHLSPGAFRRQV